MGQMSAWAHVSSSSQSTGPVRCVMTVENVFKWLQTQMGWRCGGTCVGPASGPWMAQLGALSPLQTRVTGPLRSGVIQGPVCAAYPSQR